MVSIGSIDLARIKKSKEFSCMDHSMSLIQQRIRDTIRTKQQLLESDEVLRQIVRAADTMALTLQNGGRVLFCGNGGSAADAQHFAAELSGKFLREREPLDAEALHGNTSYLTAVANDYGYEHIYSRLVRAKGRPGDVFIGISTSGNSLNIIHALKAARAIGMCAVGLTGEDGGEMAAHCDILIAVPSKSTPRIQECHLLVGHLLCELVEEACVSEVIE
jgi:D-sedoheptulose 7-phosphate isomerase